MLTFFQVLKCTPPKKQKRSPQKKKIIRSAHIKDFKVINFALKKKKTLYF